MRSGSMSLERKKLRSDDPEYLKRTGSANVGLRPLKIPETTRIRAHSLWLRR